MDLLVLGFKFYEKNCTGSLINDTYTRSLHYQGICTKIHGMECPVTFLNQIPQKHVKYQTFIKTCTIHPKITNSCKNNTPPPHIF